MILDHAPESGTINHYLLILSFLTNVAVATLTQVDHLAHHQHHLKKDQDPRKRNMDPEIEGQLLKKRGPSQQQN